MRTKQCFSFVQWQCFTILHLKKPSHNCTNLVWLQNNEAKKQKKLPKQKGTLVQCNGVRKQNIVHDQNFLGVLSLCLFLWSILLRCSAIRKIYCSPEPITAIHVILQSISCFACNITGISFEILSSIHMKLTRFVLHVLPLKSSLTLCAERKENTDCQ